MFHIFRSYPVAPGTVPRCSTLVFANLGTLGLGTLDAAGAVLANAAGGVPLLDPLGFDVPVQGLVPPHARGILGAQVDQGRLKRGKFVVKTSINQEIFGLF